MIEHWSSAKVQVYLEEKDKEIESLEEAVVILTQQRNEEEQRTEQCVKFLWTLLHPEEMGWAVSQEVREQARKTLITIYGAMLTQVKYPSMADRYIFRYVGRPLLFFPPPSASPGILLPRFRR